MQTVRDAKLAMHLLSTSPKLKAQDKETFASLSEWLSTVSTRAANWQARPSSPTAPSAGAENHSIVTLNLPGASATPRPAAPVSSSRRLCAFDADGSVFSGESLFKRVRGPADFEGYDGTSLVAAMLKAGHVFHAESSDEYSAFNRAVQSSLAARAVGEERGGDRGVDTVQQVACLVRSLAAQRWEIFVAVAVVMAGFDQKHLDQKVPPYVRSRALAVLGRELLVLGAGLGNCHDLDSKLGEKNAREDKGRNAFSRSSLAEVIASEYKSDANLLGLCGKVLEMDLEVRASSLSSMELARKSSGMPDRPVGGGGARNCKPGHDLPPERRKSILKKEAYLKDLESIEWHREGGFVRVPRWQRFLAVAYVVFAVILSVVVGAANLGNRSGPFERISDAVQTASVLLVSVFGLLKLTSEDQNAIRNSLFGWKVLRTARDVEKAVGVDRERELKLLVAQTPVEMKWLDPDGAGYATAVYATSSGAIRLSRGMALSEFYKAGWRIDGHRMVRWDRGFGPPPGISGLAFTCGKDGHARIGNRDSNKLNLVYPSFCDTFYCPVEIR